MIVPHVWLQTHYDDHAHAFGSQPPEPDVVEQLRTTAVREITAHANNAEVCARCGRTWPCERAVLAEHNLALL